MNATFLWQAGLACLITVCDGAPSSMDEGVVKRDGFELHFRASGSGTPVVLLSGGPGIEVDYMVPFAEFLPASYRRIFVEQRGTGRSQPPELNAETMTLALVVEDLEALRVQLGQEKLFLAGHSWGGMLAMAYAAAHPDRVERLILVGSGGPTNEFRAWFGDNIRVRMRPEEVAAMEYWAASAERGAGPDKVALEISRAMTPSYFFDRKNAPAFLDGYRDGSLHSQVNGLLSNDMRQQYDLVPGLRSLACRVLIVQGRQDPIGDLTADQIHRAITGSDLRMIEKCGHFPWLEQPDRFRRVIAEFLEAK